MAPKGLGLFVSDAERLGGWEETARLALDCGAKWLAPRAGAMGWDRDKLTARTIEQLASAMPEGVFPWIQTGPDSYRGELASFASLVDAGATGLIVEAGVEWVRDKCAWANTANVYCHELLEVAGDRWVAAFVSDRSIRWPNFPLASFATLDAILMQVFAYEHDDRGHLVRLAKTREEWKWWLRNEQAPDRPFFPVAGSYRPRARSGIPVHPRHVDVADDVERFLDFLIAPDEAFSIYSLDAAAPTVLSMLRRREARKRTDRIPIPFFKNADEPRPSSDQPTRPNTPSTRRMIAVQTEGRDEGDDTERTRRIEVEPKK